MIARDLIRDDQRFTLLSNIKSPTSIGPSSARNLALAAVTTDLVCFCDIDDLWHPEKLSLQVPFHLANHCDISTSAYARFNDRTNSIVSTHLPPSIITRPLLYRSNPLPMLTTMVNTHLLLDGFPEVRHEDYLLWLNLFRSNRRLNVRTLPYLLSFYAVHDTSLTSNRMHMPFWVFGVFTSHMNSKLQSIPLLMYWLLSQALSRSLLIIRSLISPSYFRGLDVFSLLVLPPYPLPPA